MFAITMWTLFSFMQGIQREIKSSENGAKIYHWDHKKYIQNSLAQSIEHLRRSLLNKLFMLEGHGKGRDWL